MRLYSKPTSPLVALAGMASSNLPAFAPRFTTAMRAATFFCSAAGKSFDVRSAISALALLSGKSSLSMRA